MSQKHKQLEKRQAEIRKEVKNAAGSFANRLIDGRPKYFPMRAWLKLIQFILNRAFPDII
jgi:hypothetical protein